MTQLKISPGNKKIGKIPNLSFPPGVTCTPDIPCLNDGCYAMKAYRMYPNVREAWDSNYRLYLEDQSAFFSELIMFFHEHHPERFRLFVGGDCPDEAFFVSMCDILYAWPAVNVLMFTKRYEWALANLSQIPPNFKVVLSMWPGKPLPEGWEALPSAWLEEDARRPKDQIHIKCPGSCSDCEHQCWDALSTELPVFFNRH